MAIGVKGPDGHNLNRFYCALLSWPLPQPLELVCAHSIDNTHTDNIRPVHNC